MIAYAINNHVQSSFRSHRAKNTMFSAKRKAEILELICDHKQIGVAELLDRFDVSIATIRRDLSSLQKEGLIKRTRGGAVLEKRSLVDLSYQERERKFIQSKIRIAEKALEYIETGDRVFFNDGTTIMQIAKQLARKDTSISVMTNSIKVADILLFNKNIDVILIGGDIREFSYASSGPLAELMLDSLNANKAIIGADAFHPERGVSIHPIAEASLSRKMISNSDKVIVVGDSSKMGSIASVTVCKWEEVDVFITDSINSEARRKIEGYHVVIPYLK